MASRKPKTFHMFLNINFHCQQWVMMGVIFHQHTCKNLLTQLGICSTAWHLNFLLKDIGISHLQQITALHDSARSKKDCRTSKERAYFRVWPSIIKAMSFSLPSESPRFAQCWVRAALVAYRVHTKRERRIVHFSIISLSLQSMVVNNNYWVLKPKE